MKKIKKTHISLLTDTIRILEPRQDMARVHGGDIGSAIHCRTQPQTFCICPP